MVRDGRNSHPTLMLWVKNSVCVVTWRPALPPTLYISHHKMSIPIQAHPWWWSICLGIQSAHMQVWSVKSSGSTKTQFAQLLAMALIHLQQLQTLLPMPAKIYIHSPGSVFLAKCAVLQQCHTSVFIAYCKCPSLAAQCKGVSWFLFSALTWTALSVKNQPLYSGTMWVFILNSIHSKIRMSSIHLRCGSKNYLHNLIASHSSKME